MAIKLNRRQVISGMTIGSVLLKSPLAFGSSQKDLETYIQRIVFENFPGSLQNEDKVKAFASNLVNQKIELLEDATFISKESKKNHSEKFERFIVVQYATSGAQLSQ